MALFGRTSERLKRIRIAGGATGLPHHYTPLGARELRAQAVHRLQVGLFGLAAMLLLVSLASVIMQRVQTSDRSTVPGGASPSASASPAGDPLVDMGVAPEVPVSTSTQSPNGGHKAGKTDSK